ncbi:MAG: rRNA maturation RNase YbeY [Clostridia bacterium]|nr:rRNA maturation RNase YbeY [Clostridia bacterium]
MIINFNRLNNEELKQKITKVFEVALSQTKTKNNISVNITVVGEQTIKQLNSEHRKINKVTDVLSFPLNEGTDFASEEFLDKNTLTDLGDIVICNKRAQKQATDYGHSYEREMCFLSLHGLLHLLGYDHMQTDEEKVMFSLQDKILNKCDIGR